MEIETTTGRVEGERSESDVVAYRGIRYGVLAEGRRFDPIAAPAAGDPPQDRRALPAVFPQLPSRLGAVMGHAVEEHPQEEDAFLLNLWAPEGATGLPVFVFVHGGAFVSGGGVVRWYDGSRLAAEGRMVVVSVNYRLGPLAHMVTDDSKDPNRSVGDLLEALRWVRANVARFGGDPDAITVGGQSAGGFYSQLLAVHPVSRSWLRGLFLMSAPDKPAATTASNEHFSRLVQDSLDGDDPRQVPAERLVRGHLQAMAAEATFGAVPLGLMPTAVGDVPTWLDDADEVARRLAASDVLITFTHDEAAAFFHTGPTRDVTREQLAEIGVDAAADEDPYQALVGHVTESLCRGFARRLGAAVTAAGATATVREFTVESPMPGVGACHCLDLPFLFGNRAQWTDAPMLAGLDDTTFERESAAMRKVVTDLVHGRPSR